MTGEFEVRYTDAARDDVLRLFESCSIGLKPSKISMEHSQHHRLGSQSRLSRGPFIFRKPD